MSIDKALDSVKDYFDSRLKNPYFGAVIAVWVFCNRKLVFGVFNFDDSQTLSQRMDWVSVQLNSFKGIHFREGYLFEGYTGGILYALILGFVTMAFFSYLNGIGKIWNKLINRTLSSWLQKIEPAKWISITDAAKLTTEIKTLETELRNKKDELNVSNLEIERGKNTIGLHSRTITELEKVRDENQTKILTLGNEILEAKQMGELKTNQLRSEQENLENEIKKLTKASNKLTNEKIDSVLLKLLNPKFRIQLEFIEEPPANTGRVQQFDNPAHLKLWMSSMEETKQIEFLRFENQFLFYKLSDGSEGRATVDTIH